MRNLVSVVAFSMVMFLIKTNACEAADREGEQGLASTAIMRSSSYCGVEPIKQEKNGSGDCNHQGVLRRYSIEKLNGVPVRKWSVLGSVSTLEIATGCYCVIDE
jgi:hypothetical protein